MRVAVKNHALPVYKKIEWPHYYASLKAQYNVYHLGENSYVFNMYSC